MASWTKGLTLKLGLKQPETPQPHANQLPLTLCFSCASPPAQSYLPYQ